MMKSSCPPTNYSAKSNRNFSKEKNFEKQFCESELKTKVVHKNGGNERNQYCNNGGYSVNTTYAGSDDHIYGSEYSASNSHLASLAKPSLIKTKNVPPKSSNFDYRKSKSLTKSYNYRPKTLGKQEECISSNTEAFNSAESRKNDVRTNLNSFDKATNKVEKCVSKSEHSSYDESHSFEKVENLVNKVLSPRKNDTSDFNALETQLKKLSMENRVERSFSNNVPTESSSNAIKPKSGSLEQELNTHSTKLFKNDLSNINYGDLDKLLRQNRFINETINSSKVSVQESSSSFKTRGRGFLNPRDIQSNDIYESGRKKPTETHTTAEVPSKNLTTKSKRSSFTIENGENYFESVGNYGPTEVDQFPQGVSNDGCYIDDSPMMQQQQSGFYMTEPVVSHYADPEENPDNNIVLDLKYGAGYSNYHDYFDFNQQCTTLPDMSLSEHVYYTNQGKFSFAHNYNFYDGNMDYCSAPALDNACTSADVYNGSYMNESYYMQFPSMDVYNTPNTSAQQAAAVSNVKKGAQVAVAANTQVSVNSSTKKDYLQTSEAKSKNVVVDNSVTKMTSIHISPGQQSMHSIHTPLSGYPINRAISTAVLTSPKSSVFNEKTNKLELFRNNSAAFAGMTLKDIQGWIVDFSRDQHGSRFIQQKMEKSTNGVDREIVFKEITLNDNVLYNLMTDVFGNYVVQKMLEFGNEEQKREISKHLKNRVLILTTQMYGCRVVQKAIECIPKDLQSQVIHELDGHVLECVKDQNGNHVIQKCIEHVPADNLDFIIKEFNGKVFELSSHPYGCRVIQRLMEHCEPNQTNGLMKEIFDDVPELVRDQYGNYVIQHILDHKKHMVYPTKIIQYVFDNIFKLSSHKFASNVVEKCIQFSSLSQKENLVRSILKSSDGGCNDSLYNMMKDPFANYVVQKIVDSVSGELRKQLLLKMKPYFINLKKLTYGKHMINKVDRWLKETESMNTLIRCDDDFPSLDDSNGSPGI